VVKGTTAFRRFIDGGSAVGRRTRRVVKPPPELSPALGPESSSPPPEQPRHQRKPRDLRGKSEEVGVETPGPSLSHPVAHDVPAPATATTVTFEPGLDEDKKGRAAGPKKRGRRHRKATNGGRPQELTADARREHLTFSWEYGIAPPAGLIDEDGRVDGIAGATPEGVTFGPGEWGKLRDVRLDPVPAGWERATQKGSEPERLPGAIGVEYGLLTDRWSWQEEQRKDPAIAEIRHHLDASEPPPTGDVPLGERLGRSTDPIDLRASHFVLGEDGVLCLVWEPSLVRKTDPVLRIVVPRQRRAQVLHDLHAAVGCAHLGRDKTYQRAQSRFYWAGMWADVTAYVRGCTTCQQRKSRPGKQLGWLKPIPRPSVPWHTVSMDLIKLTPTPRGNQVAVVFVCHFSRFVEVAPLPDSTAAGVARAFFDCIIARHGTPVRILSDQGREFTTSVMEGLCALTGTKRLRTAGYSPATNGLVEKWNRSLLAMLAAFCASQHSSWDLWLQSAAFASNTSVHPALGVSPYSLNYGREARLPLDLIIEDDLRVYQETTLPPRARVTYEEYRAELITRLREAFGYARRHYEAYQLGKIRTANDNRARVVFEVGARVWLYVPQVPRRSGTQKQIRKLGRLWTGPYEIVERVNPELYRLRQRNGEELVNLAPISRLKECYDAFEAPPTERMTDEAATTTGASELYEDGADLPVHRDGRRRPLTYADTAVEMLVDHLGSVDWSHGADAGPQ
jgi:transposase InsO family protein